MPPLPKAFKRDHYLHRPYPQHLMLPQPHPRYGLASCPISTDPNGSFFDHGSECYTEQHSGRLTQRSQCGNHEHTLPSLRQLLAANSSICLSDPALRPSTETCNFLKGRSCINGSPSDMSCSQGDRETPLRRQTCSKNTHGDTPLLSNDITAKSGFKCRSTCEDGSVCPKVKDGKPAKGDWVSQSITITALSRLSNLLGYHESRKASQTARSGMHRLP